tara:strand:+ start:86 stop:640 length:555 start_codon:yes stop_codon:yes gene_type:complete
MVSTRNINKIIPDLEDNLERDLNKLVTAIIADLSTEENSPVDTGFFASSWTAGTQRPRPDEARESVAPWSNIKPTRRGARSPQAKIEPRFINSIPQFKPFSKVFIGNRSQYAARALASPRSKIPQYVQGDLRNLINQIFTDKPKLGIAAFGTGVRGKSKNVRFTGGGIGAFSDPSSVFVDYETP